VQANKKTPSVTELLSPRLFKALSDPNRVALMLELAGCGGSSTVGEAARCCPVDLSVVSRHLGVLRDAGIVEPARRGKQVHYRLRADVLVARLRAIADAIENCCKINGCCGPTSAKKGKGP
jgi:DNA-binding transcriptional ArsR family regulator